MKATFPSKVDGKLFFVGLALPCVALIAMSSTPGRAVLFPAALVTVLVAVLVVWIVFSTYYEITKDLLIARSGPFSWRIPLEEISRVRESRSARSGPALSMDRLEITWSGGNVLLISPKDKTRFLAALRARAPQLAALERGG